MGNDAETMVSIGGVTRTFALELPRETLERYQVAAVIGRGGMGQVEVARDRRIQRDVAIKRMRDDVGGEAATARFLREAMIQACLDHPAIVPVHELGADDDGRPYFTMKRLTGTTLGELLARGTESLQRLLRAFVDVALAIDFAHARGIVHRDLKPANIMLGDFGEVYVLDWGLARVLDAADSLPPMHVANLEPMERLDGETTAGALLGTPGYMPPEQLHDASRVTRAADVYALGAILFELLAGEPLHPRDAALEHTLSEFDPSPGARAPQRAVPPELDVLCLRALATAPSARPTARWLADRVQSFLDGDRDEARRRSLAADAVALARRELAANRRDEAMHAAARALALDPASAQASGAAELVTGLMLAPPETPPPALVAELEAMESEITSNHARRAALAFSLFALTLPLFAWNGVRDWSGVVALLAFAGALLGVALVLAWRPALGGAILPLYAVGNALLLFVASSIVGPLVVAPSLVCVVLAFILQYPSLLRRAALTSAVVMSGWIAAIVLELVGVMASTWNFEAGGLVIRSQVLELAGQETWVFLLASTAAAIVVCAAMSASLSRANLGARRQLLFQRWQLGRLLPKV